MSVLCPVSRRCGACPRIEQSDDVQRRNKSEEVERLLTDRGLPSAVSFHPAKSPTAYRNRIRLRVDEDGKLTFFNTAKALDCAVLETPLVHLLQRLSDFSQRRPGFFSGFSHAELRAPDLDGRAGLFLAGGLYTADEQERSQFQERLQNELHTPLLVDMQGAERNLCVGRLPPQLPVTQRVYASSDVFQRVPLTGFMQVNSTINQALVDRVVAHALRIGAGSVVDLYCGSGNFLLPLAARGLSAIGVELVPESIQGARAAAREQSLTVELFCGTVESWLRSTDRREIDLAVVDPPRKGLKGALSPLLALRPAHIALCSCSPPSLATDLGELASAGYELERVELFDMFRHTDHVEVLCLLKDKGLAT